MRERIIAEYLKREVKKAGGWAVKIRGEGVDGVPDYLVALNGLHVVETKKPKAGRLSEIQKWFHGEFGQRGAKVSVCFTKEDVDLFIIEILYL